MRAAIQPAPVLVHPVIPASCRVDPTEPQPLPQPELPPLPARPASDALSSGLLAHFIVRTQRAEIAGLYFQNELAEERETRAANAATQADCAAWARAQP